MRKPPVLTPLLAGGVYFEAPRWHDGHWYVSDVYAGQVVRVTSDGKSDLILEHSGPVSGPGWLPDGRLLAVAMTEKTVLAVPADGGAAAVHADLTGLVRGELNDMVVDPHGRAYAGAVGFDLIGGEAPQPAVLALVTPDGRASVAADGLMFPNGAVVTDDGTTLIVAETFGARLTAFDIGPDGALTNRRTWAPLPQGFFPTASAWTRTATSGWPTRPPDGSPASVLAAR
jgi:sugar lactone lactonase YvrE